MATTSTPRILSTVVTLLICGVKPKSTRNKFDGKDTSGKDTSRNRFAHKTPSACIRRGFPHTLGTQPLAACKAGAQTAGFSGGS